MLPVDASIPGMLDRLANVMYWFACAVAVFFIGFGAVFVHDREFTAGALVAGLGVVCWIIGWAVRYVLVGR
jgi:hypothetical protein